MAVMLRAWRAPVVLHSSVWGPRVLCAGEAGSRGRLPGLLLRLPAPPPPGLAASSRLLSRSSVFLAGKDGADSGGGAVEGVEKKPNKTQQLKRVFKEYGGVAVSFHVAISLTSLGIFYLLVSRSVLLGLDVTALLLRVGFSEAVVQSRLAAGTSTFVLAYAIHKLFAPVRISITVVSVPFLVRYLRRVGIFKPPPPPS